MTNEERAKLLEAEMEHYSQLRKIWPERIENTKKEAPNVTPEQIINRYKIDHRH